jgi:hypothetical protein
MPIQNLKKMKIDEQSTNLLMGRGLGIELSKYLIKEGVRYHQGRYT